MAGARKSGREGGGRAQLRAGLVRLVWVVGIALAVLAPLGLRAAWEGRAEMEAARRAAASADLQGQILHLGRAARWRMPLARHDDEAIDALMSLGEQLEARGEEGRMDALRAYREARRALLATRSWGVPEPESFERANARIAALMALQEADYSSDLSGEGEQEAWHLERLSEVPGPRPGLANAAALSFVAWVVAVVGFVVFAIDAQGRVRARPAVRWGVVALALMVGWMVLTRVA